MNDHFLQFQREKTALKYFLIGRNYHKALKALGFVERYHNGLRKNGKTPELHHQVQIALTIIQLKDLINEEDCIVAALLHDTPEDYGVPLEQIEIEFGTLMRDVVWRLTKKFAGMIKNKKEYIDAIALCSTASIVKGVDRNNNLESMTNVFSTPKMGEYSAEADDLFLPMLKKAGKLFPEQQAAYNSVMQQMKKNILSTRNYVEAVTLRDVEIDSRDTQIDVLTRELHDLKVKLTTEKLVEATRLTVVNSEQNTEAFRKALTALLLTFKHVGRPVREQILEIRKIADELRIQFGISSLSTTDYGPELMLLGEEFRG